VDVVHHQHERGELADAADPGAVGDLGDADDDDQDEDVEIGEGQLFDVVLGEALDQLLLVYVVHYLNLENRLGKLGEYWHTMMINVLFIGYGNYFSLFGFMRLVSLLHRTLLDLTRKS
jgi:hypothetical protein